MSISYKKGVYTLKEIGEIVLKKCPGRFASLDSAYARAKGEAQRLGIADINGKKRCKLIAAKDAEAIVKSIQKSGRSRKRAQQISLFDENPIEWLDDYLPEEKKGPAPIPVPAGMTQEQAEAIEEFWQAWTKLCEAFGIKEVI